MERQSFFAQPDVPRNGIFLILFLSLIGGILSFSKNEKKREEVLMPVIDGEWWSITSQPDIGKYTGENQQPVDFGVWQARDGTWQLWSCIRGTKAGGNGRLFFHWEGKSLRDTSWRPMGIAMMADTSIGETKGGLQAPFVLKENGIINEHNNAALFSGPLYNTRDPMVLKTGDMYYCYYSAHNEKDNHTREPQGAIFCRTSKDLKKWSEPTIVSRGGAPQSQTQWYGGDIECPFVVRINDKYILFRNQKYGPDYLNTQYCSSDPLNFGDNKDDNMVGQLHVAAPEIIKDGEQYYIVSLKPGLNGMKMAKLKFVTVAR